MILNNKKTFSTFLTYSTLRFKNFFDFLAVKISWFNFRFVRKRSCMKKKVLLTAIVLGALFLWSCDNPENTPTSADVPGKIVNPPPPNVPEDSSDPGEPESPDEPDNPDVPDIPGAANEGGNSGEGEGSGTTVAAPARPGKPLVEAAGGKLTVSWTPAARAETYDLYYRDAAESNSDTPLAEPQLTGLAGSTVETALDPAKVWYVWVRAVNAGGASSASLRGMGGLGPVFSTLTALAAWLVSLPPNTPFSPYAVRLENIHMGASGNAMSGAPSLDGLRPLYDSFGGRYLSLDLDACTGATIGWGTWHAPNPEGRPDRDKLINVVPPAGSTKLGQYNFQDCVNLKTVRFPPNLKAINARAFQGCVSLEAVDLPATLESIGTEAFSGCVALKTIVCRAAEPPTLENSSAFSGLPEYLVIKVPAAGVNAYKTKWSAYAAKITTMDGEE
jgi:hypothetical protein